MPICKESEVGRFLIHSHVFSYKFKKRRLFSMIYQLKITLTGTTPLIWRRIHISSHITFANLHDILQILFEWEGEHLHLFEVTRTDGIIMRNQEIMIGSTDCFMVEATYAELDCTIENWLTTEKDTCRYIYDFGHYWQHEIVLEKIVDVGEATYFFPICRKAVGEAPVEYVLENNKFGNEDLKTAINQQLKHLWGRLN